MVIGSFFGLLLIYVVYNVWYSFGSAKGSDVLGCDASPAALSTPPMPGGPSSTPTMRSLPPVGSPQAPSLPPASTQLLTTNSTPRPTAGSTKSLQDNSPDLGGKSRASSFGSTSLTLRIPMLMDAKIGDGRSIPITDSAGSRKFLVEVQPRTYTPTGVPDIPDVREYLRLFIQTAWGKQEVAICALAGSGALKFTCQAFVNSTANQRPKFVSHGLPAAYGKGSKLGEIAEDTELGKSEYVDTAPYTLRSPGCDNKPGKPLLTILRTTDGGNNLLKIMSPHSTPPILADVIEHFKEDFYEAACYPGADAVQVVLMILALDRLLDYKARNRFLR